MIVSVFYVIAAYAEVAGFGFDLAVITSPEVAERRCSRSGRRGARFGLGVLAEGLLLVVFLDMLAVYVGAAVASTRGVSRWRATGGCPGGRHRCPSATGRRRARSSLLMAIQALLIVASEAWDDLFALEGLPHYFSLFVWCSTFGAFALIVVYFLLSIGRSPGRRRIPRDRGGLIVASLVGIAITAAAIFGSFYKVPSPTIPLRGTR